MADDVSLSELDSLGEMIESVAVLAVLVALSMLVFRVRSTRRASHPRDSRGLFEARDGAW